MAGRPKAYDLNSIINIATDLFWSKGYAGASLTDLTTAMNVSKSTFYTAFKSKDDLYKRCLEHYGKSFFREMVKIVAHDDSVIESIKGFFIKIAEEEAVNPPAKGCLLVSSANEIGTNHPVLSPVITELMGITRSTFRNALELAKRKGELSATYNADAGSTFLVNQMCGLRTLVKAGFTFDDLHHLVEDIMIQLKNSDRG